MSTFIDELKASSDARLDRWHEVLLSRYFAALGKGGAEAAILFERLRQVELELERRENHRLVAVARRRRKQESPKLHAVS